MLMGPGAWNAVMKTHTLTAASKLVRFGNIAYQTIAEGWIRMAHVLQDKNPGEAVPWDSSTHYAVVIREEEGATDKMIEEVSTAFSLTVQTSLTS